MHFKRVLFTYWCQTQLIVVAVKKRASNELLKVFDLAADGTLGGGEEGLADDSDEDTWSDGFTLLLPPPPA